MSDPEGRKLRDPYGREFYGQSRDVLWRGLTGELAGVHSKVLFGNEGEEDPKAQIWECAPNLVVRRNVVPFGEYHILLEGLAWLGDREMKPYSMRFVVGDDSSTPLTSGPEGATWLILTFDQVIRG